MKYRQDNKPTNTYIQLSKLTSNKNMRHLLTYNNNNKIIGISVINIDTQYRL